MWLLLQINSSSVNGVGVVPAVVAHVSLLTQKYSTTMVLLSPQKTEFGQFSTVEWIGSELFYGFYWCLGTCVW